MDQTQIKRGLRSFHNSKMTTKVTFLYIDSENGKELVAVGGGLVSTHLFTCFVHSQSLHGSVGAEGLS